MKTMAGSDTNVGGGLSVVEAVVVGVDIVIGRCNETDGRTEK